jgi:hypothetical protein
MQVLAGLETYEASRFTARNMLLDQWEKAAAQVGRKLLVDRHMFDISCANL